MLILVVQPSLFKLSAKSLIRKMDYALLASVITIVLFFAGVIYGMGKHSSRLESLETWRVNVRNDMHEISEKLGELLTKVDKVTVLVEERTERRNEPRTK